MKPGHSEEPVEPELRQLYELALSLDEPVGKMMSTAKAISDDAVRARYKKVVGDLMGFIYAELMFPIEKIYPQLIPEKEKR